MRATTGLRAWAAIFARRLRSDEKSGNTPTQDQAAGEPAPNLDGPSYSTDRPIHSSTHDRFSRVHFAYRIADTISGRADTSGLVLGLYGQWGDGKTSVLHMIEERLKEHPDVVVAHFNPWQFTTEDQLLRGFFDTLSAAVGAQLTSKKEEFGAALKKYGSVLSVVNGGDAATGLGEALSTTTLENLKARVEGFLADGRLRVVVLVDDIDRLDRAETHLIFKLVKLSAGFSRTTYLLAFDDDVVAAALGERYGAGGDASGRAFLEKIIQVPLHLPSAETSALRELIYEGLNQALSVAEISLPQQQIDAFVVRFGAIEESLNTPRQARLYTNSLLFSLPMVKGEVHIGEFMLLEALKLFHPRLYRTLRENASLLLGRIDRDAEQRRNQFSQMIEDATRELTPERRKRMVSGVLHALFPRMGLAGYGPEWESEWSREQRLCSSSYFQKFFAYGVSGSQLSDRHLQQFLNDLPQKTIAEQDTALQELAKPAVVASLIQRLRQHENHLPDAVAIELAPLLARNGRLFPYERGMLSTGGVFTQAGVVIYFLLRGIRDSGAKLELAREVLRTASPVPFASEILRWMFPSPSFTPEEQVFEESDFNGLRAQLVTESIIPSDAFEPLYRQFGSRAIMPYSWWKEVDSNGLANRLVACLDSDNSEVDHFLDAFVGEAWDMSTGVPHRSDLDRNDYDSIARLIDPEVVAARLRLRYGPELDSPQYHQNAQVPLAHRFAHQFMHMHVNAVAQADERSKDQLPGDDDQLS